MYGPFLDRVLRARYITLCLGLMILVITLGYIKSGRMGFEMFPNVEADVALCAYTLPYGSPVEDTRSIQDQLLQAGDTAITKIEKEFGVPIVKGAQSTIGGRTWGRMNLGGGHAGRIRYELLPPNERPISTEEFAQRWRAEATGIKGLKSIRFRARTAVGQVEIKTPSASASLIVIWMY